MNRQVPAFRTGIQTKILIPMVIMLFASILVISIYSYLQQKRMINNLMNNIVTTALEQIIQGVDQSGNAISALKSALNRNYLRQVRAIRKIFEATQEPPTTEQAIALAKYIGVDEIHVVDADGILKWGNIPEFYGFDFQTADQTRPLLEGLTKKQFELAQAPQKRGVDKVLFQYITVARQDRPGLIQIGVQPRELQALIQKTDIQAIIQGQKVGEKGHAVLIDNKGTIIADPDAQKIGTDISGFNWGKQIIDQKKGVLKYMFNNEEYLSAFEQKDDKIVIATLLTQSYMAPLKALRTRIIMVAILSILISFMVVFLISKRIVISVNNAVTGLKNISEGEGDLTQRLEIKSRDEVGELAHWFNAFIFRMQEIVKDISNNAVALSASSTEVTDLSIQISQEAENMSESSAMVAAAAKEMNSNMCSVAAASEQASLNINMVATATEEMTSTINEIAQNSEKTRSVTDDMVAHARVVSGKVNELGRATVDIGKVTEAITDISEQINLLALNATIEAARAGESGKGFAVVANEIKALAKQTSAATLEIKEKIGGVQLSTKETVDQVDKISAVIKNVNEMVTTIAAAVEEQSATTNEIAGNVLQASKGIQEVNHNVAESSTVSEQIAKEIFEVNHAATQMSDNNSKVNTRAHDLSELAETLKKMVEQFKV